MTQAELKSENKPYTQDDPMKKIDCLHRQTDGGIAVLMLPEHDRQQGRNQLRHQCETEIAPPHPDERADQAEICVGH